MTGVAGTLRVCGRYIINGKVTADITICNVLLCLLIAYSILTCLDYQAKNRDALFGNA